MQEIKVSVLYKAGFLKIFHKALLKGIKIQGPLQQDF